VLIGNRQLHLWLNKKGGVLEDNPHNEQNSGIPMEKIKNASLNEMMKRIEYKFRD
jgi:hypothetical protein